MYKGVSMTHLKRKIVFIINPVAGHGKTIEMLPIIKSKMSVVSDDIDYEIQISKNVGDISVIVRNNYEAGVREFVAVGGDGSLSEMINGFSFPCDPIPSIAILPLGSGNDFIKNTVEKKEIDRIFDAIILNKKQLIDVGKVNDYYFINVCSFGIDGPIIKDTDKLKKFLPGQMSYLTSTLKGGITFKPSQVEVKVDGVHYSGKMILIAIGNGQYFGGGMKICPDAKYDDGLLEVCLVNNVNKLKFMSKISKVYSGELHQIEEVSYIKGKQISIDVKGQQYLINVDGNLLGLTPAQISILEKSVYYFTNS